MYKVCIYNNLVETIVHYPAADKTLPHINGLPLKEGLSLVDSLSFNLYPNNPGYNSVCDLATKVKVFDIRDNSIRFTGRVLEVSEHMDNSGLFYKEVLCEGALSYLNDSKQRDNTFLTANPTDFLAQILTIHNAKVDSSKQIQVGNVDVMGSISHNCDYETTLATILAVKEKIGGDIRVREASGLLYLDWLQSLSSTTISINLGQNMKDIIKSKDITSIGTRIIPLGANNLTISSVNNGVDYIEDTNAKNIYGVIEIIVEYRDIEDAAELYAKCLSDLSNYTQPKYLLESNTLDLSYLSGNKSEQFTLGVNLHIVNSVMGVDSIYKAVELALDLLQPYDPKLTIANSPIKLSSTINSLRKSMLQNNGVYNKVQVGDAFGIRAVRSDGKVTTTLNATEGISIEKEDVKVFFVDTEGNINFTGIITGPTLRTAVEGGRIEITGSGFISYDSNNKPRISINAVDSLGYQELRFFGQSGEYEGTLSGTDGQLNIVADTKLLLGATNQGIFINASLFDFQGAVVDFTDAVVQGLNFAPINHAHDEYAALYHTHTSFYELDIETGLTCQSLGVDNNMHVYGSLTVDGVKNAYVETLNHGKVLLVCDESPNAIFADRGSGVIGEDGICIINLDPVYLETVNTSSKDYYINLQGIKTNNIILDTIETIYFTVVGQPGARFLWKVEAERKGYEGKRFNQVLELKEG